MNLEMEVTSVICRNDQQEFSAALVGYELEEGELLDHAELTRVPMPDMQAAPRTEGIVFSGRLPVWCYAYLTHQAHPYAWVATHSPRDGGAVVVCAHVKNAPAVGTMVKW